MIACGLSLDNLCHDEHRTRKRGVHGIAAKDLMAVRACKQEREPYDKLEECEHDGQQQGRKPVVPPELDREAGGAMAPTVMIAQKRAGPSTKRGKSAAVSRT